MCGAMTSGGTESILSAVKASRDYMRAKRGIREPEMIIANSAHAAFFKAADFFKIRLVKVHSPATMTSMTPTPGLLRRLGPKHGVAHLAHKCGILPPQGAPTLPSSRRLWLVRRLACIAIICS